MLKFLIISLLAWGIYSQPAQLICFQSVDEDMSNMDSMKVDAMNMMTQEMKGMDTSGMSDEEYTSMMTGMINKTFVTMAQDQMQDNSTIGPFVSATMQGLMEMPGMMEGMMKTYVEQPKNVAVLFGTITSNMDYGCYSKNDVVLLQAFSAIASSLSKEASKEQLADIIVQTGISLATTYNLTENWINIMEGLTSAIPDTMPDVPDVINRYLGMDDVVVQLMNGALQGIGLKNPSENAVVASDFFVRIIDEYSLEGNDVLYYLQDIFSGLLEGLQ